MATKLFYVFFLRYTATELIGNEDSMNQSDEDGDVKDLYKGKAMLQKHMEKSKNINFEHTLLKKIFVGILICISEAF